MHITIDAECLRGLRIIEEIPDIGLCKLEGYNGIGKTSAIRLLQLCTGEQPFEGNDAAWRSFRAQLISARVKITGLRGADSIEWDLDPKRWPDNASEELVKRLGKIRIDNNLAEISAVRELLKIYHLYTTEAPISILADQAEAAGNTVEGWYQRIGDKRSTQLYNSMTEAVNMISGAPIEQARLARELRRRTQDAADDVTERATAVRGQVDLLSKAVEISDQLNIVRGSQPLVAGQVQDLETELARIDADIERLNDQIGQAQLKKHLSDQAKSTIERAEKLVERRKRALKKARDELQHLSLAAGADPTISRISQLAENVTRDLERLVLQQPLAGTDLRLLSILTNLHRELEEAISTDLGGITLIEAADVHPAWTIAQMRDLFQEQIRRVSQRTHDSNSEQIAQRIRAARRRIDLLAAAREAWDSAVRAEQLVNEAEDALATATAQIGGTVDDQLNILLRQRGIAERQGRELQSRIDRLKAELTLLGGGKAEEVLAAELLDLCRMAKTDAGRIRSALDRAQGDLDRLIAEATQASSRAASLTSQLRDDVDAIDIVINQLVNDSDLDWLRRANPTVIGLSEANFEQKLSVLEDVEARIRESLDSIEGTRAAVRGIGSAFHELAARLRSPDTRSIIAQAWTYPTGMWLAEQAKQWLDDETMRQALFRGGSDIRLDPEQMTVAWSVDGEDFVRPLSVFSSGEQTFAFTRARVARLEQDSDAAANRLIALDEFGAYLDANRFARMVEYLVERRERVPDDQVLVILPYGSASAGGDSATEGNVRRAQALARRGYFTEELRT